MQAIGEFIDDTEDYVNITLDSHRNQLIQVLLRALSALPPHTTFPACVDTPCWWFRAQLQSRSAVVVRRKQSTSTQFRT